MSLILVIDDEDALRLIIRRILERAGHSVLDASDGREGVALTQAQDFDLIITDLLMPEMDGIETIREIRARGISIPILAMSGGGSSEASARLFLGAAAKLGANAILAKPFRAAELLQSIKALLPKPDGETQPAKQPGEVT